MQVHGDYMICTCHRQHVCNQLGRDWSSTLVQEKKTVYDKFNSFIKMSAFCFQAVIHKQLLKGELIKIASFHQLVIRL